MSTIARTCLCAIAVATIAGCGKGEQAAPTRPPTAAASPAPPAVPKVQPPSVEAKPADDWAPGLATEAYRTAHFAAEAPKPAIEQFQRAAAPQYQHRPQYQGNSEHESQRTRTDRNSGGVGPNFEAILALRSQLEAARRELADMESRLANLRTEARGNLGAGVMNAGERKSLQSSIDAQRQRVQSLEDQTRRAESSR